MLLDSLDDVVHFRRRFADGEPADGITRQVQLGNLFHVAYPQLRENGALIDAEEHLSPVDGVGLFHPSPKLVPAPDEPARPSCRRTAPHTPPATESRRIRRTPWQCRNPDWPGIRMLSSGDMKMRRPSIWDANVTPSSEIFLRPGKRKNLKTAAVCQNRSVPVHKPVQASLTPDKLVARPEMEVIGIGQFYLAPDALEILGRQRAFDGGLRCRRS